MSDPTNDELRRRIASLLGWTNIIETKFNFVGRPPNIEAHPGYQEWIPTWTEDLNAAAVLLSTNHLGWCLRYNGRDWEVLIIDFPLQLLASDPNPARAICLAFVAMHEEQTNE